MSRQADKDYLDFLSRHKVLIGRVCSQYAKGDDYVYSEMQQKTYIVLYEEYRVHGLSRLRNRDKEAIWVSSIACNVAASFWRSRGRQLPLAPAGKSDEEIADVADEEEAAADEELLAELHKLLQQLSSKEHRLVEEYLAGYPYAQIAVHLGVSVGAVNMRMRRVKRKLRILAGQRNKDKKEDKG